MENKQALGLGQWRQGWQEVAFRDTKAQQNSVICWMWCKETMQEQNPVSVEAMPWTDRTQEKPVWADDSVFGLRCICLKDLCDGQVHGWVVMSEVQARDLSHRERL